MIITGLTPPSWSTTSSPRAPASLARPTRPGIEAWRWMYLMQAVPAVVFLVALFFIPESPRYLVTKGRDEKATRVLTSLFGAEVARGKLGEIRASFAEDHRPRLSDVGRRAARHPPDRLGGHHAGDVPAVRRHQRHLLLRRDAVEAGRRHRGPVAAAQHRLRRGLDRGLLRDHRADRQDRPQAAAADRLGRHGGDAGRDDLGVQQRQARCGGQAAAVDRTSA